MVRGCWALGFPVWKDAAGGPRLAQVGGYVPTAEGTEPLAGSRRGAADDPEDPRPGIEIPPVLAGDQDQPGSRWAGMSGAVVVTADDQVIGVVRGHSPAEGMGSLTATRLEAIGSLPPDVAARFLAALGMPGVPEWPRLPGPRRDARLSQAPAVPGWVDRAELAQVVAALTDPVSGTVVVTTGLTGAGGFGKTMLAARACQDREVLRRFRGGIVWVTVGRDTHGSALAARISEVIAAAGGDGPAFTSPEQAGQALARVLAGRGRTLLVADDVWTAGQLEPFLAAGQAGGLLVTTRQPEVLDDVAAPRITVDKMPARAARLLLTRGLPPVDQRLERELLGLTGQWPLLLNLVNHRLAADVRRGAASMSRQRPWLGG